MENNNHNFLLDLGFTDNGYDPSFETFVCEAGKGNKDDRIKMTVNRCPELIRATIIALRHKSEKLSSQAAVTRFLTQQGFPIIQKIKSVKILKDKRKWAFENGEERDRLKLSGRFYDFGYRISIARQRISVYAEDWVGGASMELATDIGIAQETVIIMSLIAASATSKKWIPDRHSSLMRNELVYFVKWVDGLAEEQDSAL